MRKNKKGFTLIELIAVLVILAIIALIVTPLVMNIVKKAKDSANKRSVDGYGKSVELAVATYLLDNGDYPTTLDNLTVEYTGNEVVCNTQTLNEDGSIYLSECSVKGAEVKDANTEDGWYHYGKTSSTAPITYQSYNVGDVVTYNGMEFYVIEASDEASDRVTMLKAEPLTVDEVNTYGGVGTENNHVNMYNNSTGSSAYRTAYDKNGYGGMAYYTSVDCGYGDDSNHTSEGCTSDYAQSEVKYVVDAWKAEKAPAATEARLISYEDLLNDLGYENSVTCTGGCYYSGSLENVPNWVYNSNYWYWTMSPNNDSASYVWNVYFDGGLGNYFDVHDHNYVVRPVITLLKSSI